MGPGGGGGNADFNVESAGAIGAGAIGAIDTLEDRDEMDSFGSSNRTAPIGPMEGGKALISSA
jgi:hypothetical protein